MRKQFQGLQGIVNEEFGRYLTQDEALSDKEDEAGWSSNGSRHVGRLASGNLRYD